jgi:hypothetical protein
MSITNAEFIPGLVLNEMFYHEVAESVLAKKFPEVAHSAGLTSSRTALI